MSGAEPLAKETERTTVVETVDEQELYGPSQELLQNITAALAKGTR